MRKYAINAVASTSSVLDSHTHWAASEEAVDIVLFGNRIEAAMRASGRYRPSMVKPTLDMHSFSRGVESFGTIYLQQATEGFAKKMTDNSESLGAEFAQILEDNFWDLLIR